VNTTVAPLIGASALSVTRTLSAGVRVVTLVVAPGVTVARPEPPLVK